MHMEQLTVGCVVMAAGNALRFGENKLSAVVRGRKLIEHALDAVPDGAFGAVCVVTQYDEVARLAAQRGFAVVRNDRPQDGLSRTVRLGTQALRGKCGAILYLVSDQPLLRRESIDALLAFCRAHPGRIVAAAHGGKRGNPCVFPASCFDALCDLSGDVGGSAIIRAHEDEVLLFEVDAEELLDVDTKETLHSLER